MTTVNSTSLRRRLAAVLAEVENDHRRVWITRRGRAVAALVPIEDLELIERLEDEIDVREAKKALKEAETEGTIPFDSVKAELGL